MFRFLLPRRPAPWLVILLLLTASLAGVTGPVRAQSARYTYTFQDAEVSQVAGEVLGRAMGVTYVIDPAVTGRISFRIDQRMTKRQLFEAFESALAASDLVMVRQNDSLLITTRAKARASVGVSGAAQVSGGGYQTVTVPLTHVTPTEAAKALTALGPANVVLLADDKAGTVVLGGSPRELEAAMQTLKTLDNSNMRGAKVRWFPLANASARTLAAELNQVLRASGVAANIVPMPRLNGLYAFANTDGALEEAARWVERLDRAAEPEIGRLWVYHPRNVTAENLGRTLNGIFGSGDAPPDDPPEAPEPRPGGDRGLPPPGPSIPSGRSDRSDSQVRVSVDKESNSVVISAPPAERAQIEKVLREIDVSPGQVQVEASILEVTLNDDFRLGVDWSVLAGAGELRITSTSDSSGGVSPSYPGFSITFIDDDIRAAVDALGGRTNVEVVSTPRIVVLDNRTAKLQIGNQVPVVTETSQSNASVDAPRVVTIEYRDTGVILEVTPRISGEDRVTLNIVQEVSSVARTTTSGIDSPTIQQRRLESSLRLRSGDTIALGGLFSTSRSDGDSGVPLLKDIPVMGTLFKSQTKENRRTELIVLITVRVLPTDGGSDGQVDAMLADLTEMKARGLLPRP
ncbi:MAG TPA: type II secretion system secretin GspD [Caulobacter sp.]|nr:type II secretion system secretin GspD [Caulobacter sp.]